MGKLFLLNINSLYMSRTGKSVSGEFLVMKVTGWSGGYQRNQRVDVSWHYSQPYS